MRGEFVARSRRSVNGEGGQITLNLWAVYNSVGISREGVAAKSSCRANYHAGGGPFSGYQRSGLQPPEGRE
ncbi:hypothetical protein CAAN1_03S06590 [[Candida] anglica]